MDNTPVDDAPTSGSANLVTSGGVYDAINTKTEFFRDLVVSGWVSDTTYSDFPYRCDIPYAGVTSGDFVDVVFSVEQATSGNYAPICETYDNGLYLYSKVADTITIPTITIFKGVRA